MQINRTILSIPPFISTTWDNVLCLKTEGSTLIIRLKTGETVTITNLSDAALQAIFEAHVQSQTPSPPISMSIPLKPNLEGLPPTGPLCHNPDQATMENIPHEVLEKISTVAKAFGFDDYSLSEPNCNCVYCQIAREKSPANVLNDEALQTPDWDIEQTGEKLYRVTNIFDANEQYNVFLGEPLGCTCGSKHCEHIKAVLST